MHYPLFSQIAYFLPKWCNQKESLFCIFQLSSFVSPQYKEKPKIRKTLPHIYVGLIFFQVAAQAVGLNSVAIRERFKIRMQGNSGYIWKEPLNLRMTGRPHKTEVQCPRVFSDQSNILAVWYECDLAPPFKQDQHCLFGEPSQVAAGPRCQP